MLLLQEMLGDDGRLLDDSFFFEADDQSDELRHAPGERCGAAGAFAEDEMRLRGLSAIPNLLGNHAAGVGEMQHRIEIEGSVVPAGDLVFASFAGENRPDPSDAFAEPRAAEISFAVAIVIVAMEAGAVGRFNANRGVNDLQPSARSWRSLAGRIPRRTNSRNPASTTSRSSHIAAAVANVELIAIVRVRVVVHANVIALRGERAAEMAGGGHQHFFDVGSPFVGGFGVTCGVFVCAIFPGDVCGADQARDFRGDRRRRISGNFLPALFLGSLVRG